MERFAAAHSCALRLLIQGGRGRGEWKAAWVIPWLSGTRPGLQLAAADKTHSHLLQLRWLWACGEGEDGGYGACPRRSKHLIPPWVSTNHRGFPRVLYHPTDPTQLPGSSHLPDWAHSISLCAPRSRQEAPGDSEGQEKGMAKRGAVKNGNMVFEISEPHNIEMQCICTSTGRDRCLELSVDFSVCLFPGWTMPINPTFRSKEQLKKK